MRISTLKPTKYAIPQIIIATAVLDMLLVALVCMGIFVSWIFWLLAVIPAVVLMWVFWFFRDPERSAPPGEHLFVSPADGLVSDITNVGQNSPLGCDGIKIGVFMNVFNVHVNRCPAAARVQRIEHLDGLFLDARNPLAAEKNESTTIYLTHSRGGRDYPIVVRQIAGLIARRIVTDLQEGESIQRSRRIGMIKFGSRLELLVPDELVNRICVRVGEKVFAGQSVLVEAKNDG